MKAFLDTNVLLSAYYFNGNERRVLTLCPISSERTPWVSGGF